MTVSLDPRIDFAFKKLFGSEENKECLISLINSIVSKEDQITDVTLLNPYNEREYREDKLSVLDIKATDEKGQYYNVEMQITNQVHYNQRALYYWARLYSSQIKTGSAYKNLKRTISINLLNFNYFNDEAGYHHVFHLLNVRSKKRYFQDLELHFIELARFDKELAYIKTALDRWSLFLTKVYNYGKNNIPPELGADPAVAKAIVTLEHLYLDDVERMLYEGQLKWFMDRTSETRELDDAMEEGIEQGIKKGIEKGELRKSKAIARALWEEGMPIERISSVTGLTIDVVKSL
jgi:predicted transposase/invertase (TIGR01784 family)